MPGNFMCANAACTNKDAGRHLTARAAGECREFGPAGRGVLGSASVMTPPQPYARSAAPLARLSEYHAEGLMTDHDVLALPEYCDLEPEHKEVLLDLVVADSDYAPKGASGYDLADYVDAAYTRFDSLTAWAENELEMSSVGVETGESPENFAERALMNEIWTLPKRDGSGEYRVMRRTEAI